MSLAAQAMTLRGLDPDAAASAMEEAVGYWATLTELMPAAYAPWLGRGLTDLADLLKEAGRKGDVSQWAIPEA